MVVQEQAFGGARKYFEMAGRNANGAKPEPDEPNREGDHKKTGPLGGIHNEQD